MTGEMACGANQREAPEVNDLNEARLAHACGKADACEGPSPVPAGAVTIDLAKAGLVPVVDLRDNSKVLPRWPSKPTPPAHPDGTQYWQACPSAAVPRRPTCGSGPDRPSWATCSPGPGRGRALAGPGRGPVIPGSAGAPRWSWGRAGTRTPRACPRTSSCKSAGLGASKHCEGGT